MLGIVISPWLKTTSRYRKWIDGWMLLTVLFIAFILYFPYFGRNAGLRQHGATDSSFKQMRVKYEKLTLLWNSSAQSNMWVSPARLSNGLQDLLAHEHGQQYRARIWFRTAVTRIAPSACGTFLSSAWKSCWELNYVSQSGGILMRLKLLLNGVCGGVILSNMEEVRSRVDRVDSNGYIVAKHPVLYNRTTQPNPVARWCDFSQKSFSVRSFGSDSVDPIVSGWRV